MSEETTLGLASEQLEKDATSLSLMSLYTSNNLEGMDERITDYLKSNYKMDQLVIALNDLSSRTKSYKDWIQNMQIEPPTTEEPADDIEFLEPWEEEKTTIQPDELDNLSDSPRISLQNLLEYLGYSDAEIQKILKGEKALTKEKMDQVKELLYQIDEIDPEQANQMRELLGIREEQKEETVPQEEPSVYAKHKKKIEAEMANSKDSPYIGRGKDVHIIESSAVVVTAAALAATGAAATGGVIAGKGLMYTRFTPKDWRALGPTYQKRIAKIMKRSGLTETEIHTFQTASFKILTSELKEHIKKIKKAMKINPHCDEDIENLYNYSMFDEEDEIIPYLLFITMVIDGKNVVDEYNMYNVINPNFDEEDEVNGSYAGIDMDDYIDDDIIIEDYEEEKSSKEEKKYTPRKTESDNGIIS